MHKLHGRFGADSNDANTLATSYRESSDGRNKRYRRVRFGFAVCIIQTAVFFAHISTYLSTDIIRPGDGTDRSNRLDGDVGPARSGDEVLVSAMLSPA